MLPRAAADWPALVTALTTRADWPDAIGLARAWYDPHLDRIHEDAESRRGEALQASLAVPVEVQILLLGDSTLLADDHTLAEYSLPSSEPPAGQAADASGHVRSQRASPPVGSASSSSTASKRS